jgi:hypothetical protein
MRKSKVFLAGLTILLTVFTVAALIGCDNPTTTEEGYFDVAPVENLTLSQLIDKDGGALFQNASRSVRLFKDGDFAVFNMGLFMFRQAEATYGKRYKLDGDTIKVYRTDDADDAPFYTITYTLEEHTLTISKKTNGAGTAPDNTNLPLGKYSFGKLPAYRGD